MVVVEMENVMKLRSRAPAIHPSMETTATSVRYPRIFSPHVTSTLMYFQGPVFPCFASTECDQCLQNTSCGWCDTTKTCMDGTLEGPLEGGCLDWHIETCPCTYYFIQKVHCKPFFFRFGFIRRTWFLSALGHVFHLFTISSSYYVVGLTYILLKKLFLVHRFFFRSGFNRTTWFFPNRDFFCIFTISSSHGVVVLFSDPSLAPVLYFFAFFFTVLAIMMLLINVISLVRSDAAFIQGRPDDIEVRSTWWRNQRSAKTWVRICPECSCVLLLMMNIKNQRIIRWFLMFIINNKSQEHS